MVKPSDVTGCLGLESKKCVAVEPALVCLSGAEMCGSAKTLMPETLHAVIDYFLQSLADNPRKESRKHEIAHWFCIWSQL